MATIAFDGWETQFYGGYLPDGYGGQDYLMHFRTKGSKNGVRRYQEADGTWTPLGLKERRAREGWGERRAARKEARRAAKAERRAAKAAARSENLERARQYKAQQAEARRKRNPKNLTDEELRTGIERLKMEQEYRELSKSPALKVGERLVAKYMDYRVSKLKAEAEKEERRFQYAKLNVERANTKDRADADKLRAKADAERAKADLKDIQKGTRKLKLLNERTNNKNQAKRLRADTTIRGGIAKLVNQTLSGIGDAKYTVIRGKADAKVAVKQSKKLLKYNIKIGKHGPHASIPEGGFPQYAPTKTSNNQKQKDKNKNKDKS